MPGSAMKVLFSALVNARLLPRSNVPAPCTGCDFAAAVLAFT